jgi:hypothetical protein
MSDASARLIQSPDELAIQSSFPADELPPLPDAGRSLFAGSAEPVEVDPLDAVPVDPSLPDAVPPSEPVAVLESSLARPFDARELDDPLDERRSTLAHPEPLNTIAGRESAFRIVPSAPHSGQNRGPDSLIPWITSVVLPQWLQA